MILYVVTLQSTDNDLLISFNWLYVGYEEYQIWYA